MFLVRYPKGTPHLQVTFSVCLFVSVTGCHFLNTGMDAGPSPTLQGANWWQIVILKVSMVRGINSKIMLNPYHLVII